MERKTIVIISSLDTKGTEASFLKTAVEGLGHRAILMDTNTGGEPAVTPDITADAVAKEAGGDIRQIRQSRDTARAAGVMIAGATSRLTRMLRAGEIDGAISFGGASNTAVATTIMKALPFGFPKVMVSSTAAMPAYAGGYFGTSDMTVFHSVVDIAGLNPLVRDVLKRGAGVICGMAQAAGELRASVLRAESVALTEFKFSERCCVEARRLLEDRGLDVIPFHAQGVGDRAMEELIGQGLFQGVLDIVPAGLSEELLGGNRAAGPHRLERAGEMGIPQVITPCGFDMLSCGPLDRRDQNDPLWVSKKLSSRKSFIPDAFRVQVRTSTDETREIAAALADKANRAKGPVEILVPMRGWSALDREGGPLYDPEADAAFLTELKARVKPAVRVTEVDLNLNTLEFARVAVDRFLDLISVRTATSA